MPIKAKYDVMRCKFCEKICIKKGKAKNVQRFQCTCCKKYQQANYVKPRIPQEKYDWTVRLNNEGCGISNIARLLEISKSSVQRLIERIVANLQMPKINEYGQSYEIDELRTYCGNKRNELWLIYAINRCSKQVINFVVGKRTKENIAIVVSVLQKLHPKAIYSDRLNIYKILICKSIHKIYPRCINYIERKNLTLRTCLKRLSRKTICFTRCEKMLHCVVCLLVQKQVVYR
ncbi:MAG: IS1 family transposase [Defluviitaleaceae bacterium]|nr:IS1 family transposase [Defluviitaleaceae bacterium]